VTEAKAKARVGTMRRPRSDYTGKKKILVMDCAILLTIGCSNIFLRGTEGFVVLSRGRCFWTLGCGYD